MKLATIAAIVGITLLQSLAVWKGVDSNFFWLSITAIAGLGGYTIKRSSDITKGG